MSTKDTKLTLRFILWLCRGLGLFLHLFYRLFFDSVNQGDGFCSFIFSFLWRSHNGLHFTVEVSQNIEMFVADILTFLQFVFQSTNFLLQILHFCLQFITSFLNSLV